jgi:hypothetical protein
MVILQLGHTTFERKQKRTMAMGLCERGKLWSASCHSIHAFWYSGGGCGVLKTLYSRRHCFYMKGQIKTKTFGQEKRPSHARRQKLYRGICPVFVLPSIHATLDVRWQEDKWAVEQID